MVQLFKAYSFLNVQVSIVGPGIACSLGNDAGSAEGGVSIEMAEDKSTMTIGADGSGMHSMHAGQGGTITIRLLKASTTNFLLSAAYDVQAASSTLWGRNTIVITDTENGDVVTGFGAAFRRNPNNTWAKDASPLEWAFNCIRIYSVLASATSSIATSA